MRRRLHGRCAVLSEQDPKFATALLQPREGVVGIYPILHYFPVQVPRDRTPIPGSQALIPGKQPLIPGNQSLIPGNQSLIPGTLRPIPGNQQLDPGNRVSVPRDRSYLES
jgi:hypothetical protein